MKIKPLLLLYNGTVNMERVRTHKKAIAWLLQKLEDLHPVEQIVLLHTHATEEIEALGQQIHTHFPELPRPWCLDVTTALGAHLGPAGVGFTCVTADEAGFVVACGGSSRLAVRRVVPEGRRSMTAAEFLRGSSLRVGLQLADPPGAGDTARSAR